MHEFLSIGISARGSSARIFDQGHAVFRGAALRRFSPCGVSFRDERNRGTCGNVWSVRGGRRCRRQSFPGEFDARSIKLTSHARGTKWRILGWEPENYKIRTVGIGLTSAALIAGAMSNLGLKMVLQCCWRLPDADPRTNSFAKGDLVGGDSGAQGPAALRSI